MIWIDIIRWAIFLTFILLVVLYIVGYIVARRFYRLYVSKHLDLEARVTALERRAHV